MRRILLTVSACALGLTLTSTVEAHPPRHAPAHVYYRDHGVRFSGGYYFAGVQFQTPLDPEALDSLRQFCRPGPS